MKKKDFIAIFSVIALVIFCFLVKELGNKEPGQSIKIVQNNNLIGIYPLRENRIINLNGNVIQISDNTAFISDADCPDLLCKKQQPIFNVGEQIVCLPNKVVISVLGQNNAITRSSIYFNTSVTVTIYDSEDEKLLDTVMQMCNEYELICSRTNPDSELYKLNHRLINPIYSGDKSARYPISKELYDMIKIGLEYGKYSNGAFNIAIAPISDLWNFSSNKFNVPEAAEINKQLNNISLSDISLNDDGTISFKKDNNMIDLGGMAKGYIADKIKEYLVSQNVKSATISLGGNILCIGDKSGVPFKIGIQKPFEPNGISITDISVSDKSVVTSGIYERYFKKDNHIYHHILDTNTGYPIENDIYGITIVTDKSVDGDCLSTWLYSLGSKEAMDYAKNHPEIKVIIIDENYNIIE